MIRVLSTKTLTNETVVYANGQGVKLQCLDFISTQPVSIDVACLNMHAFDAVVFTSSNAVKYFFENGNSAAFEDKLIFSLSGKTANEFLKYNVTPTYVAVNASSLADALIGIRGVKSALHICGNLKLDVIQTRLEAVDINYTPLVVYATQFVNNLQLEQMFDAVMFYSPTGVESYLMHNEVHDNMVCCCIGETTAEALRLKRRGIKIIVAAKPMPEAMIDETIKYFQTREIGTWPN